VVAGDRRTDTGVDANEQHADAGPNAIAKPQRRPFTVRGGAFLPYILQAGTLSLGFHSSTFPSAFTIHPSTGLGVTLSLSKGQHSTLQGSS
jgi:hypothetical protein